MHPLNSLYSQLADAAARGLIEIAITPTNSSNDLHKTTIHFPITTPKKTIMKFYDHLLTVYNDHFTFINYAEFPQDTVVIFMEQAHTADVPNRNLLILDNTHNQQEVS